MTDNSSSNQTDGVVDSIIIIGIDPAKINIGITILQHSHGAPPIALYTGRTPYKSDNYFVAHLLSLIRTYGQRLPVKIVIERQPHNSSISSNMRYVEGYFRALGASTVMRMAMTHGLHIATYKDRKNYSLQTAIDRASQVECPQVLLTALSNDDRKHDIADSFNLAFDESVRITNDNSGRGGSVSRRKVPKSSVYGGAVPKSILPASSGGVCANSVRSKNVKDDLVQSNKKH